MTCARLVQHYRGLTWADVRGMALRDFNALVEQMAEDIEERERAEGRSSRGRSGGERRTPVMT
nr:hypothetical protein KPHV_40580 [Kitasatospora purpeofusca]